MTPTRLLRVAEVLNRRGRKRSPHYADIASGTFTPPVRLGEKCSAWPEHEVEAIVRAQIAGATKDELRALVKKLLVERKQLMPKVAA